MRTRTILALAAIAGCAALGTFAATGLGDDDPTAAGPTRFEIVRPALEPAGGDVAARAKGGERKPKGASVTHLITTNPVPVDADGQLVAELICKKSQGVPISGGAIALGAPAQVAVSVVSRFNPNPPFDPEPGSYYVGVRNFDPVNPSEFRATVVCAKGVKEN